MSTSTKEKVVILTGASRGIGLATAHFLLTTSHCRTLLIARTAAPLHALETQYGSAHVAVLAGDMADDTLAGRAVGLAMEKWGRVDGVVVNHGVLAPVGRVGAWAGGVAEWRRAFDVNVFGTVGLIQAALPPLSLSPTPRIILTSSGASTTPYATWAAYGCSKAALNHLAATLAVEEPHIVTLSIRPGVVDTDMQREIREVHAEKMSKGDRDKFLGLKENGGLLRPEQPGRVIARLAVAEGEAIQGLSGRYLSWNDELLKEFQD